MNWLSDFVIWLYYWQTLVAGILALAGAYCTVRHIRLQIEQAKEVREDEISRRRRSARIVLPLTLASISKVIEEIAENVAYAREQFDSNGSLKIIATLEVPPLPRHFQSVTIPQETLESFQSFVETLDSPIEIQHVHVLFATLQILTSRYNSFELGTAGVASVLDDLLVYTGKAKLLNDIIFEYSRQPSARNFSLVHGISNEGIWDQIEVAAQGLVFRRPSPDFFYPAIAEIIKRMKETDANPWAHGV